METQSLFCLVLSILWDIMKKYSDRRSQIYLPREALTKVWKLRVYSVLSFQLSEILWRSTQTKGVRKYFCSSESLWWVEFIFLPMISKTFWKEYLINFISLGKDWRKYGNLLFIVLKVNILEEIIEKHFDRGRDICLKPFFSSEYLLVNWVYLSS